MPKKSTLKSRRNKRNVSLKKKSRKGGAVWDFLKSKEKPEPKEEPEDDLKKVVAEEIPLYLNQKHLTNFKTYSQKEFH